MKTDITYKHAGCIIKVHQDEHAESPREWEGISKMVCFHKRYNLGDFDHKNPPPFSSDDFSGWDEMENHIMKEEKALVCLPLYLYDHSGITMKTSPFSCGWDSGQVGFIYVTKEDAKKNWPKKSREKCADYRKRIESYLDGDVETYDHFLTGEVYGYTVEDEETGEEGDSCWGYYGYDETKEDSYMIKDCAKPEAEALRKKIDNLKRETAFAECCP